VLRQAVGGARELEVPGGTVSEVLESLYSMHPGVRSQLVTPEGDLHRFVNVYVNDEDARLLSWMDTPVGERDTVLILPAMAGGGSAGPAAHGASAARRQHA